MSRLPLGEIKVAALTFASVGAGASVIGVAPAAAGVVWRIIHCVGWHAAGANRDSGWYFTTPEVPAGTALTPTIDLVTVTPLALGAPAASLEGFFDDLWVDASRYPSFLWTAVSVGENAYVRVVYEEIVGIGV